MARGGSCGCGGSCGGEKTAAPGDSSATATSMSEDSGGKGAGGDAGSAPAAPSAEGKSTVPATGKGEGTIAPQDTALRGGGGGGDGGKSLLVTDEAPCKCFCVPFSDFLDVPGVVALPPTTVENAGIIDVEHVAMELAAAVVQGLPTVGAPVGVVPVSTLPDPGAGIGSAGPLGLGAASAPSGWRLREPGGLEAGPYGFLDEGTETSFAASAAPNSLARGADRRGPAALRGVPSPPADAVPGTAVFQSAPGTALTPGSAPTAAVVPWNGDGGGGGGANTEPIPIAVLVEPPDSRVLGEAPPATAERDPKAPPHAGNFAFRGADARAGAGLRSLGFPAIDHGFEGAGYDREVVTQPAGPAAADLPDSLDVARPVQGRIGSADLEDHGYQTVPDQAFADLGRPVGNTEIDQPGANSPSWADLADVPKPGSATAVLAEPAGCCTASAAAGTGLAAMPGSGVAPAGPGSLGMRVPGGGMGPAVPGSGGAAALGLSTPSLGGGGGGGGVAGVAAAKAAHDKAQAAHAAKGEFDGAKRAVSEAQQKVADAAKSGDKEAQKQAAREYGDALDQEAAAQKKYDDAGGYGGDDESSQKAKEEDDKEYQKALDNMGGNAEQLDKLIADEQARQAKYKTWEQEREGKERKRVRNYDAQKKADAALRSSRSSRDTNNSTKSALSGMKGSGLSNPGTYAGFAYMQAKSTHKDAEQARDDAHKAAKDAKRAATHGTKEQGDRAAAKAESRAAVADTKADYAAARTEEARVKADKKSTPAQTARAEANSAQGNADVKQAEANDKKREADNARKDADKANGKNPDSPTAKRKEAEAKKKEGEARQAQKDADKAQDEADKKADEEEEKENPSPPPPPPCMCVPPCPPGSYCFCLPPPPPGGDPRPGGGGGGKGKGAPGGSVMPDDTKTAPAGAEKGDEEDNKHPGDGDEDRYADPEDRDRGGGGDGGGDGGGNGQGRGRRGYGTPTEPPLTPPDGHDYWTPRVRRPNEDDDNDDGGRRPPVGPSSGTGPGAHIYAQDGPQPPPPQPQEKPPKAAKWRNIELKGDDCERILALIALIRAIIADLKSKAKEAGNEDDEAFLDDPKFFWLMMAITWHESALRKARNQKNRIGGPGSGVSQFESAKTYDVAGYVLKQKEKWSRNLAETASVSGNPVTYQELLQALKAFRVKENHPKGSFYNWPGGNRIPEGYPNDPQPTDPAKNVRFWILHSDSFALKLTGIQFTSVRSKVQREFDKLGDVTPSSDKAMTGYAEIWFEQWKGDPVTIAAQEIARDEKRPDDKRKFKTEAAKKARLAAARNKRVRLLALFSGHVKLLRDMIKKCIEELNKIIKDPKTSESDRKAAQRSADSFSRALGGR